MRQFYQTFQKRDTLRPELTWSHYRRLISVENDNPTLGIILCSQKIEAIVKYSVLSDGKQLFASRYQLYLPTEDEFKRMLESIE